MAAKKISDPFAPATEENNVTTGPWENDVDTDDTTQIRATLKGGAGYDAPWLTVDTKTLAKMDSVFSETDALKGVLDKVHSAGSYFASKGAKPAPAASGGNGAPPANQISGETKTCKHGTMTPRSGFKNGRAWSGFFCPTPRGSEDQCEPIFIK